MFSFPHRLYNNAIIFTMPQKLYDATIIGAGASGLMSAIRCGKKGLDVLLLDGKEKAGSKILMSGGSRCNITNKTVSEKNFVSNQSRFVRNVLRAFPPEKTLSFFNELGVNLVLENNGKYFPETHSAKTILSAFLKEIEKYNISFIKNEKINSILFKDSVFNIKSEQNLYQSKTVLLATGGLSYPETGSDGSGYAIARSFGHTIIPTSPGLTPLLTNASYWQDLSGISIPCKLSLFSREKLQIFFAGPLLFTHFGFSGPTALNISRHWLRLKDDSSTKILMNFLPDETEGNLLSEMISSIKKDPFLTFPKFLLKKLPARLAYFLLRKIRVTENKNLSEISTQKRRDVINELFNYPLPVSDVYGYSKAEITAGGITLEELDYKTLESKLQKGLFFAGEILDVDGQIGGFNFQWAWASAFVASSEIIKSFGLKK